MRISAISKATVLVVALVSIATVASTVILYMSIQDEKATLRREAEFKQLSIDLAHASDYLTEEIQRYVATGDPQYYDNFWHEVDITQTRERVVARLKEMNAPKAELDLIEMAKRASDALIGVEEAAMSLVANQDLVGARALIFGPDYEARKREILGNIARFQGLLAQRVTKETTAAQHHTEALLLLTSILVGALAITALYTAYMVTQRRIVRPLGRMTEAMLSLAGGNTAVTIPDTARGDEIADMSQALQVFRDNVHERAQAEQALRESEKRLRAILAVSPIGVAIARVSDGTLVYGNRRMAEQIGLDEAALIGLTETALYGDPTQRTALLARLDEEGFVKDAEICCKQSDGATFWALLSLYPIDFGGEAARLEWIYDITERKRAETRLRETKEQAEAALAELKTTQARLLQAEKLASLGQLTAGIAHEIKNPLNFINNFSEVSIELFDELRDALAAASDSLQGDDKDEVEDLIKDLNLNLAKIKEHGKRADGIVRSMLEHSRQSGGKREITDINVLLERFVSIAYHGMRTQHSDFNVTLEASYDPALPEIAVYPQDLGRVFLNIVANACQAMHEKKQVMGADYEPVLQVGTRLVDGAVEVRIHDNGPGVPKTIADRIFQPFFTTKATGEGTGLGLSISYDVVTQQHGGRLELDSQEGKFTAFTICLPADLSPQGAEVSATV